MADNVRLEVQLTNIGSQTLYVYDDICWNLGNFLTIHVLTPDGKEVSGKMDSWRDCLPPPPHRDDLSRFTRLEPQRFYGLIENFTLQELVPGPGQYEIVVHYEPALTTDWIDKYGGPEIVKLPIWTRDEPMLISNRIRITVRA